MANNGEPRDPIVVRADDEYGKTGAKKNVDEIADFNEKADNWYAEVEKDDSDMEYIETKKTGLLIRVGLPVFFFILLVALMAFVYLKKTSAPSPDSQYAKYDIPYPDAKGPAKASAPVISPQNPPTDQAAASAEQTASVAPTEGEGDSGDTSGTGSEGSTNTYVFAPATDTTHETTQETTQETTPAATPNATADTGETTLPDSAPDPEKVLLADGGAAFTGSSVNAATQETVNAGEHTTPLGSAPGIPGDNVPTQEFPLNTTESGLVAEAPIIVPLVPEKIQKGMESTASALGREVTSDTTPAIESPSEAETGAAQETKEEPASETAETASEISAGTEAVASEKPPTDEKTPEPANAQATNKAENKPAQETPATDAPATDAPANTANTAPTTSSNAAPANASNTAPTKTANTAPANPPKPANADKAQKTTDDAAKTAQALATLEPLETTTPTAASASTPSGAKETTILSADGKKIAAFALSIFSSEDLNVSQKKLEELKGKKIGTGTLYIVNFRSQEEKLTYRIYLGFFPTYDAAKEAIAPLTEAGIAQKDSFAVNVYEDEFKSHGERLVKLAYPSAE
jgi:hypothetical protein